MTTLVFLAALVAIVIAVLTAEADGKHGPKLQHPAGLLTWLTSGNWPAKVGGALVVVGVGALLRFALINIEVHAQLKLAAGIALALALGLASALLPAGPARRPVSLALGGAAFGVAYLTAYSAFALFNFLATPTGLALLCLTSAGAAVFAVTRSAVSLALLSMVGAFLAPAFAVADGGPVIVYGYYAAASTLTLLMVALRGWRPLIHLSFLFTLGGGVFFGWSARYYTPDNSAVMLPMLLLLAALHVAMPIVEKTQANTTWLARLDVAYLLVLPALTALLAVPLAGGRPQLSQELFLLGAIWAAAALALRWLAREGAAAHGLIAGLLMLLGIAARFRNLPWELIALALAVAGLATVARLRRQVGTLHNFLAGLVLLFGAIHVIYEIATHPHAPAFFNGVFLERFIGATLLIVAGAICRRIRQSLDTLLLMVGVVWMAFTAGIELVQLQLATAALVLHWLLLLVGASLWLPYRRVRVADHNAGLLAFAIAVTAAWAALGDLADIALVLSLFVAPLVLTGIAVRPLPPTRQAADPRFGAALLAPAVAAIWAFRASAANGITQWQFGITMAVLFALVTLAVGSMVDRRRSRWLDSATEVFGSGGSLLLLLITVAAIARTPWAIVLEWLCLALLALIALIRSSRQRDTGTITVAGVVGLALVLEADMLRWLGPPRDLSILDLFHLQWPALVSLLWAVVGSGLTLWSQKAASRSLWVAGSALLVAAAIKLLLVDFGALGQLANILAVIAAGAVFLLVGWLAPLPPAAAATPPAGKDDSDDNSDGKTSWMLAMVVIGALMLLHFRHPTQHFMRQTLRQVAPPAAETIPITIGPQADDSSPDEAGDVAAPEDEAAPAEADTAPVARADTDHVAPADGSTVTAFGDAMPAPTQPAATSPWTVTRDANGRPVYTQTVPSLRESERADNPPVPAAGDQGLAQLLNEGRIRRATPQDIDTWLAATGGGRQERAQYHVIRADPTSSGTYLFRTYVVLRSMRYPEGLYGAHAATFILMRNVPPPAGDPGHSRLLAMP